MPIDRGLSIKQKTYAFSGDGGKPMVRSKFSRKIIYMAVVPLVLLVVSLMALQGVEMNRLQKSTAILTEEGLLEIYEAHMEARSGDIAEILSLKMGSVRHELRLLAQMVQKSRDDKGLLNASKEIEALAYFTNHPIYTPERHVSHTEKQGLDVGFNIWGYLHDDQGNLLEEAKAYMASLSSVKVLMGALGEFGQDKGFLYIIGPKSTPLIMSTPWTHVPESMDEHYPGHNFWDFFFPGLVEGWEAKKNTIEENPFFAQDELTSTPLYEDAAGKGLLITFFAPLWSKEEGAEAPFKNAGAVALDFEVRNLTKLLEGQGIGASGFSFVMKSDGNILAAEDHWIEILGLKAPATETTGTGVHQAYLKMGESQFQGVMDAASHIGDSNFSTHSFTDAKGKTHILAIRQIKDYNLWTGQGEEIKQDALYLGMVVPEDEILDVHFKIKREIFAVSEEIRIIALTISLLLGAIAIAVTALYAIRETKQIRLMTSGTAAIKNKDFDVKIPVISSDDLGDLAKTFNGMIKEIQSSYTQLQDYAKDLESKVDERTMHLQKANDELERLSQLDGLTNVRNRRYLDAHLDRTWRDHMRHQLPLSVIMVDIDHFKAYNDYYGHQAGDDCLRQVAQGMQDQLHRGTDILARYGGEEFCVVVSGDQEEAKKLAEILRKAVLAMQIPHEKSIIGQISISLGVHSTIPTDAGDWSQFIRHADQALYESKAAGRNRTRIK